MDTAQTGNLSSEVVQLCGFKIGGGFYAVPVLEVQEVVKPQILTTVPLAPDYIDGLINLRGQVVTAINLRKLFHITGNAPEEFMNIIVRNEDSLYSLVVDEIMDVMDVEVKTFEDTPDALDKEIKKYIKGVYKLEGKLLVLLSLEKLLNIEV
ncbi:MAG: chemotaxis protein CheW [Deltaproteobacteria bacterium]|nr:MAG: chemotaxis protein CheW [Deltaproteobacteria bacterium]TNF24679.1 MAG: chemotaxis protein CheW [Deltaproteobacteria bacterium]